MNIHELRRGADSGSRVDQSVLGLCYLYGVDVQVDHKEAFRLLSMAGTSRAVANLARMYAEGLGISRDMAKAIPLYKAVVRSQFPPHPQLAPLSRPGLAL